MLPTLRAKLSAIVAIATLAFGLLIVASMIIARSVESQMATIHERYLPRVELEPQLERSFESLRRGFQDAVAAHDPESFAATAALETTFLDELAAAGAAVEPSEASALKQAIEGYYRAAHDVSERLMAGETGEALVVAMGDMQGKQARVEGALKKAAAFDRSELGRAFAAAKRAEGAATMYRLWISVGCLAGVVLLSTWLGRGILRSLNELTSGFQRFGAGDFARPIVVTTGDELGDVAKQANDMAANLARLIEERREAEAALQLSNRELEAFSYAVAHDLRAPLRGINGFSQALLEDSADKLDDEGKDCLRRIAAGAGRMGQLIDALLTLSRVSRAEIQREDVDLGQMADAAIKQLRAANPDRVVAFENDEKVVGHGDGPLLRAVLENLLGNAWKFTKGREGARISFGATVKDGATVYSVADNGAGFDMAYANKLFAPFQRLHSARDFEGTGIGLATVQRIVHRHGGRIWAEGAVGQGATFHFTLQRSAGGDAS